MSIDKFNTRYYARQIMNEVAQNNPVPEFMWSSLCVALGVPQPKSFDMPPGHMALILLLSLLASEDW